MSKNRYIKGVRVCLVDIEMHDESGGSKLKIGKSGVDADPESAQGATEIAAAIVRALSGEPGDENGEFRDEKIEKESETPLCSLTDRQKEIALLIVNGFSNKEIAKSLQVSPSTVKNHVHAILDRLQIDRRSKIACLLRKQEDESRLR